MAFRAKNVDKSQDKLQDGITDREFPFCMFFTSQAGTVIVAFVGMTLMLITAMFNMYAENPESSTEIVIIQYCLLFLYLAIMFFGFLLAFLAAFWEVGKYLRIATFFVGAGTLIYLIMSILSFIPDRSCVLATCPALRCPDHHWLLEARWRHIVLECEEGSAGSCDEKSTPAAGMSFLRHTGVTFPPFRPFRSTVRHPVTAMLGITHKPTLLIRTKRQEEEGGGGGGGGGGNEDDNPRGSGRGGNVLLMIVSVLYTLLLLFFFVYSIITFVAYSRQLEE